MRKHWEWWEGNKKEGKTHCHRLLHATRKQGMTAVGSYLPCELREGSRCGWQNKNGRSEKILRMEGDKKKRQTNRRWLLCDIRTWGTAATGCYSPYRLREGHQHQQQNWNLIENGCNEKILGMWEKNIKTTDKLTFAGFSTWFASGGCWRWAVIPIVEWGRDSA